MNKYENTCNDNKEQQFTLNCIAGQTEVDTSMIGPVLFKRNFFSAWGKIFYLFMRPKIADTDFGRMLAVKIFVAYELSVTKIAI